MVRSDEIAQAQVGASVRVSTEDSFLVMRRLHGSELSGPAADGARRPIPLALPGVTPVPWAPCTIEARIDPQNEAPRDETIDRDKVVEPLFVRAPAPGDRFEPLGMSGKSMALADFFRGRRVPRLRRQNTPLVCDRLGIVWVAGHRIADRVKQTEDTERRLSLRMASE